MKARAELCKKVIKYYDNELRKYVEADILASSSNLFEQQKAVDEWQKMLLEISPYQRCKGTQSESENKDEL